MPSVSVWAMILLRMASGPRAPSICLISRFFDLKNGGIGLFSQMLRQGLEALGYRTTAVSTSHKSDAGYLFYTAVELAFRVPVRRYEVFHCLTPMESLYVPRRSTLVTFHDVIPLLGLEGLETHYTQGFGGGFKRFFSRCYFEAAASRAARCACIACDSEQTRRHVIERLKVPESKVSVIRLGITPGLTPQPRRDSVFRVGTLSYLDRRKRIDLLIRAFREANVDGELVIGGAGADSGRLVHLAGGDRRVRFVGFVPEERMTDFYNSLDVFVFPSRIEGYGLPVVEAFACRKPVVVLSDAILPDEIKSRCIVVDDLAGYFRNPTNECDFDGNFAFAALHSWESCVSQYVDLYRRVLG